MTLNDARFMLLRDHRDQNRPHLPWLPRALYRRYFTAHRHLTHR
ncbi:hypothetical protein [Halovulum marinum]|nr:hypothetical protein [Halovulum marinum]